MCRWFAIRESGVKRILYCQDLFSTIKQILKDTKSQNPEFHRLLKNKHVSFLRFQFFQYSYFFFFSLRGTVIGRECETSDEWCI